MACVQVGYQTKCKRYNPPNKQKYHNNISKEDNNTLEYTPLQLTGDENESKDGCFMLGRLLFLWATLSLLLTAGDSISRSVLGEAASLDDGVS